MGGSLKLGQLLVNRGILDPDHLALALAEQQETGSKLGMTLVRMGFVDEDLLIRTLAVQLKLPVARIRGKRVAAEVLACVPVDVAETHRCLPLFFKGEGAERALVVAMEDPSDALAIDEIALASAEKIRAVLVAPTELEEALQRHYHWASLTGERASWEGATAAPPARAARAPEPDAAPARFADPQPPPERAPLGDEDPFAFGTDAADAGDGAELGDRSEGGGDGDDASDALADLGVSLADLGGSLADPDAERDLGAELDAMPEPLFDADADELSGPPPMAPEVHAVPAPRVLDAARPAPREGFTPELILRALSQLLVEKGLIGRDELAARLGQLAAQEAARGARG